MAIFAAESGDSSLLASTFGNAKTTTSPLIFILAIVVLTCLITRIRTGFQNKRQSVSNPEPKEIAVLPYWIPWFGHAIPVVTRFQSFLADARSLFSPVCSILPRDMLTGSQQVHQGWRLSSNCRRHRPQHCHTPKRSQATSPAETYHPLNH